MSHHECSYREFRAAPWDDRGQRQNSGTGGSDLFITWLSTNRFAAHADSVAARASRFAAHADSVAARTSRFAAHAGSVAARASRFAAHAESVAPRMDGGAKDLPSLQLAACLSRTPLQPWAGPSPTLPSVPHRPPYLPPPPDPEHCSAAVTSIENVSQLHRGCRTV
jgi:hypothetical protein